jgi:putative transposase
MGSRLLAHIRNQFAMSREAYGSPRMHVELNEEDIRASRHRAARLMRENGLKARQKLASNAQPTAIADHARCAC